LQIIREVSCGAVHVVALSEEGVLQAWGNSIIHSLFTVFFLKLYCLYMTCKCMSMTTFID